MHVRSDSTGLPVRLRLLLVTTAFAILWTAPVCVSSDDPTSRIPCDDESDCPEGQQCLEAPSADGRVCRPPESSDAGDAEIVDGGGDGTADAASGADAADAELDASAGDAVGPEVADDAEDRGSRFVCDEPGSGQAGCGCGSDGECASGWCVARPDGSRHCTTVCEGAGDCPAGYACRSMGEEAASVCVQPAARYCWPCERDADCAPRGRGSAVSEGAPTAPRCLDAVSGGGSFCAPGCESDVDCPAGSRCEELEVEGQTRELCRPLSGACDCPPAAVAAGASTPCEVTNAHGGCSGTRTCTEAGLTACEAPTPGPETCDGTDEDCDGKTDEGFELGASCGVGACAGGTIGCAEGAAASTVCSTMPAGPAQPVAGSNDQSSAESCNGVDDDCDGKTDETFELAGTPCDGDDADACADGIHRCDGGEVVCDDDPATTAERCNGVDDDCDGATDEGFGWEGSPVGAPCEGIGACGAGTVECLDGGGGARCSTNPDGSEADVDAERCNGLDDDCDGKTDEAFAVGEPCGVGACTGGERECNAAGDGTRCDAMPAGEGQAAPGSADASSPEACNGLDDDCDGDTDEGFAVGEPCGTGACAGGRRECNAAGDGTRCATMPAGEGQDEAGSEVVADVERCNNADDDCDGKTDERFAGDGPVTWDGGPAAEQDAGKTLGEPCGAGPCAGGEVVCESPDSLTCSGLVHRKAFTDTTCDGLDDDCNGVVDDAWRGPSAVSSPYVGADDAERYLGEPCGTGACGGGEVVCGADERSLTCDSLADESAEVCNGLDDDCDGKTDEGLATPAVEADETGCATEAGVCADDAEAIAAQCVDGAWHCDYGDVAGFEPAASGSCDPASERCHCPEPGDGASCRPLVEQRCDGADDDCDGATDEDFGWQGTELGAPCSGRGGCGAGVVECRGDGDGAVCSTQPDGSEPGDAPERCNGLDDDCDGATDEGLDTDQLAVADTGCRHAEGVCGASPEAVEGACVDGSWYCDYGDVAGFEMDGAGGCDPAERACHCPEPGDGEACRPLVEQSCDGVDNDCDGFVDDEFDVGLGCDAAGDDDGCADDERRCADGGDEAVCVDLEPGAKDEVCDGVDNDCDGATDEGFDLGGDCGTGACAGGEVVCNADGTGTRCSTVDAPGEQTPDDGGATELCNGVDDDCDGDTDERFRDGGAISYDGGPAPGLDGGKTLGEACGAGPCDGGEVVCDGDDALTCSSLDEQLASSDTTCDGVDDDCNGVVDDAWREPTEASTPHERWDGVDVYLGETCGTGACDGGEVVCDPDGGALTCATLDAADDEACNGADDDCDGKTDEDFPLGETCGTGACDGGTTECGDAVDVRCSTMPAGEAQPEPGSEPAATDEACNGADDDCDGKTDEDFPDTDGDGLCDALDNCPQTANVDQADGDDDGWGDACDCAPDDGDIHPDADEIPGDGIDQNCDGDELCFRDADDDDVRPGDGSATVPSDDLDCSDPGEAFATAPTGDCNDHAPTVFPGAEELCDGLDNDCDGSPLDAEGDDDGDGFVECSLDDEGWDADGEPKQGDDCDDDDPHAHPGAAPEDGAGCFRDADGDGFGHPAPDADDVLAGTDCDDDDETVFPGAPSRCDGQLNDCDASMPLPDGQIDDDGDGYVECTVDAGGWDGDGDKLGEDCDDDDETVHPDAPERCDGLDNDCDGSRPPTERDGDGDGFVPCSLDEGGWDGSPTKQGGDCDDDDTTVHPGHKELCDGQDNDCDDTIPDVELDGDDDGYVPCPIDPDGWDGETPKSGGDCLDDHPNVHPGAEELCEGHDTDCSSSEHGDPAHADRAVEMDDDGDGYVECDVAADGGWHDDAPGDKKGNDCDETTNAASSTHPDAAPQDGDGCYQDVDDDQYGAEQPLSNDALEGTDCNDGNESVHPTATEICSNQLDDDCDDVTDETPPSLGGGCTALESCEALQDNNPSLSNGSDGGSYYSALIHPPNHGGQSFGRFEVACDLSANPAWTGFDFQDAHNELGGSMTRVNGAANDGINSDTGPYTRDGYGDHTYYYEFTISFGYDQFRVPGGYTIRANAGENYWNYEYTSEIRGNSFDQVTQGSWNVANGNAKGDVGFGSRSGVVTSFGHVGFSFSCHNCTHSWSENGDPNEAHNVPSGSKHFRVGWGEGGQQAEGWRPWFSGRIFVR